MVTRTRTQVRGLRELGQAMQALGEDVALKIARSATNAAAQVVKKAAVRNAPISDAPHQLGRRKDQIVQPGNLRRNIVVRRVPPAKSKLTSEHVVTVRRGSGRAPKDAFYGAFVEFGTVKMAPQPFLRPAIEQGRAEATEAMKKRIKVRIDKANRGGK